MYTEYTEETVQHLYDELYRLQDAVKSVDVTMPESEAIIAHLEDLITWTVQELELAGEYVC